VLYHTGVCVTANLPGESDGVDVVSYTKPDVQLLQLKLSRAYLAV